MLTKFAIINFKFPNVVAKRLKKGLSNMMGAILFNSQFMELTQLTLQ